MNWSFAEIAWEYLSPIQDQILSIFGSLLLGLIYWLFRPVVKIVWGRSNNSIHFVPGEYKKIEIHTEKYFIQNIGRKSASDIEFVMSYKPDDMSVYPARHYVEKTNPQDHHIIYIPFISKGELIIIDMVYINKRAAIIESVKCIENIGKQVEFQTVRKFSKYFERTVLLILILGFAFVIQTVGNLIVGLK